MGRKVTSDNLKESLFICSRLNDFELVIEDTYNPQQWAQYEFDTHTIRLYGNDAKGKQYPFEILLREALHELAHHFQYLHVPFWTPDPDSDDPYHDELFWNIYQSLLDTAFGKDQIEAGQYSEDAVASVKPLPYIIV